jgi:excisionase family DNA binding protein
VGRPVSSPSRRYGTLPEVAFYLGKTNKAVEKLVERRQIPFRRVQRRLIFDFAEIDQWLASLPGTTLKEALDRCTGASKEGVRGRQAGEVPISIGQEGGKA